VLKNLLSWSQDLVSRIRNGGRDRWSVTCTADSIRISKNGRTLECICTSQVDRIRALSRDAVTRDEVSLILDVGDMSYAIEEWFEGFDIFAERLGSIVALKRVNWRADLAEVKPFSGTEVVLREKDATPRQ
jgi:hypothetical protein